MADVQTWPASSSTLPSGKTTWTRGDLMTNLRLQKLLYFAQGWHLARFGRPLFDASIEAWPYGPVVPEVYRAYKEYGAGGYRFGRAACRRRLYARGI